MSLERRSAGVDAGPPPLLVDLAMPGRGATGPVSILISGTSLPVAVRAGGAAGGFDWARAMLDGEGVAGRLPEPPLEPAGSAGKMPLEPLPGPLLTTTPRAASLPPTARRGSDRRGPSPRETAC